MPPAPSTPPDWLDLVLGILTRYVSLPTAQSIVKHARQRARITSTHIDRVQLGALLEPLQRALSVFLADPVKAAKCRADLVALVDGPALDPESGPVSLRRRSLVIRIAIEDDIARSRGEARQLATELGFTTIGQTRLMTAVSELARNIVQYAGEGQIELRSVSAPDGVEITAKDAGPGIRNLDAILAGNYRSRLGMGLGLRGLKRIAERFDVQTGPERGTTVSAVIRVM